MSRRLRKLSVFVLIMLSFIVLFPTVLNADEGDKVDVTIEYDQEEYTHEESAHATIEVSNQEDFTIITSLFFGKSRKHN